MSSTEALLNEILQARNAFNTESTIFLSERLVQLDPSEANKSILAEAYISANSYNQAYELLTDSVSDRARYLRAYVSFKLDKLIEASASLMKGEGKEQEFGKIKVQGQSGSFFNPEKKAGARHYLYNLTKKGLNSFSDFFGKKKNKEGGTETVSKPSGNPPNNNGNNNQDGGKVSSKKESQLNQSGSQIAKSYELKEPNFLKVEESNTKVASEIKKSEYIYFSFNLKITKSRTMDKILDIGLKILGLTLKGKKKSFEQNRSLEVQKDSFFWVKFFKSKQFYNFF